jgi:hypothetical protein
MKVTFQDYNQMDNMYLVVTALSQDVIYADEKKTEDGTFFVKIYADGFASYGLRVDHDPLHNNEPYTWSSNPECINKVFGLADDLKLAKYDIGVKDDDRGCYFSRGILFKKACEIALEYQNLLHYGYMAFFCKNHTF